VKISYNNLSQIVFITTAESTLSNIHYLTISWNC